MKTYEAMFIFSDHLSDEELDPKIKSARGEIEALQGEVVSSTRLGRRQFARPIKKSDHGHYAVLTFRIESEHIPALHAKYKLSDGLLRVQVVLAEEASTAEEAPAEEAASTAE